MWVIFLSLLACNPEKNIEPVGPDGVDSSYKDPETSGAPAPGTMATRLASSSPPPSRERRTSPPPATGELIQNDCYANSYANQRRPSAKSPPPPPMMSPSRGLGSRGSGAGGGGVTGAAPPRAKGEGKAKPRRFDAESAAAAPARPTPVLPSPAPARDGSGFGAIGNLAKEEAAPAAEPAVTERKRAESKPVAGLADSVAMDDESEASEWSRKPAPIDKQGPVLDWGATVYLSNDDSMSLASAQRVLWAVGESRSFKASEVRPHELLNYFSFDTNPVASGETFSVLGGAEQEGETLSVALAVQGVMPERQPLDLTLVIDRSGSMRAEGRMEYVKKGLATMTEQLVDGDRVDLVLFDSKVCSPVQNFVVGRDDASILSNAIQQMQPRGSTDLDGGLREGYRIQTSRDKASKHKRNQRVLLLTDAMLNSGNVNEALVTEIGKRFEEDGIRVTGVGVGRDFNDKFLNKITEKGKGAYVYLGSEAVVDRVFGASFDSLVQTVAHDVQFSIELPDSLAMEKFYGEESSTNAEDVQPINYYAGTSQVFLQDLKVRNGRPERKDSITFRAKFRDAATGEPKESVFTTTVGALLDGDTRNLKKAQALMKWSDVLLERAMGDRSCTSLPAYRRAASQVQGDAEIAYVSGLTGTLCGVDMSQTVAATGVRFKVRVDADLPIPEVKLACDGGSWSERLSGSDSIARFEDVSPGTCRLTLAGNVPMVASVDVPTTGGDVRCLVRGGRLNCE